MKYNNIQATISAFCLLIPKSVQFHQCKEVKLRAKWWNWKWLTAPTLSSHKQNGTWLPAQMMTNILYRNFEKSFLNAGKMTSRKIFWHFLHPNFFTFILLSNISNTRDSVSSGYPNTKKRVENTTHSGVFLTKLEVFG